MSAMNNGSEQQQHLVSSSPANVAGAIAKEDVLDIYTVPTKGPSDEEEAAQKKIIDTEFLSEDDLKALKKQDPFHYYSIPAVRAATVRRGSIDTMSSTQQDGTRTAQSRRRISCPYRINSTPTSKVERRTCISFECHPDMFFHDNNVHEEVDDSDSDTQEEDANEDFDSLFEVLSHYHDKQQRAMGGSPR
ncbi:hypothetical protein ACHAWC_008910 [Mediolabrus comicus]